MPMPLDDDELNAAEQDFWDFVPAVYAKSVQEAEEYRELLEDRDIPAMVGSEDDAAQDLSPERSARRAGLARGVPVLVPESLLDEASEVIAEREDLDEFDAEEDDTEEDESEDQDEPLDLEDEELEEEDLEEQTIDQEEIAEPVDQTGEESDELDEEGADEEEPK
jgi:hypothetical protein